MSIKREWIDTVPDTQERAPLPVRQVYMWLVTTDGRIVLVSKDGEKWQLPGGKPDEGETWQQTAVREVDEETGIDISDKAENIKFFGYYTITGDQASVPSEYLQLRGYLPLRVHSEDLDLHVENEDTNQVDADAIQFVKAVQLNEAQELISWLREADEFISLKRRGLIAE